MPTEAQFFSHKRKRQEASVIREMHSSKTALCEEGNASDARPRYDRRQFNWPVSLEAFARERMGIAAKE